MLKQMDKTLALKKKIMIKKSEEDTPCLYCQEIYSTSVEVGFLVVIATGGQIIHVLV